ncbi:hypothetical protein JHK82_022469 [Glycine max]|nr:hypothetical protein JHK85_022959 [Glycine max]KAG5137738.1 hypothetical protein JHK82_022469 [Glycine max]
MRPLELLSFHDLLSFREASLTSRTSAATLHQHVFLPSVKPSVEKKNGSEKGNNKENEDTTITDVLKVEAHYDGCTPFRYPENSAPGQLPRTVDVIAEDDLVDFCKPGDRVEIVGIYKALARKRTVLIANNVSLLNKEANVPIYSVEDVKNIKEIAARDDAFDLLSNSLAPSIYGHSWIKKATVLLMLSGVEKNLKNGTHL